MEALLSIAGVVFALYLIFKLNRVVTVSIGVVNTSVELAEESVQVYSGDVRINLAKKRADQIEELAEMEFIPTNEDISKLLAGKPHTQDEAVAKRKESDI